MQITTYLKKQLFEFETYNKGVKIHLLVLATYSLIFIGFYFFIRSWNLPENELEYYQLKLSQKLVIVMILHLASLIYFRWFFFTELIKEYFIEKGSAYNLAIFRIIFFFQLGGRFLFYSPENEITWTYLPDTSRVGLPFIGWLVHNIPISPEIYMFCSITAGVLCWMLFLGLFTRYVALLSIPFIFYTLAIPVFYGKMNHLQILLWVPIFLSLAPMSDVLSIDALIKKIRKTSTPIAQHTKYILPFKMIWITLAIIYFFAGLIKLWDCGLDWALSESMINQMQWEWVEHYDKIPGFRLDQYPILAKISGLAVIYFELLYFLLILKPRIRIWALFGGYSLHKLCGYFMYIDFSDLRMIAITYLNWEKIISFLKNRFKTHEIVEQKNNFNESLLFILNKNKLKLAFFTSLTLISLNFICSVFKIHTFPFSSYPTYSGIVKNEVQIIKMNAFNTNNIEIDVKTLGEKSNFRWENIRGYELRIAETFKKQDSIELKNKLDEYWQLWRNNIKGLEHVSKVSMFLETTSIVPEKRKQILKREFLGEILVK